MIVSNGARGVRLLTARRLLCVRKTVLSLAALLPPTFAHAVDPSALPTGGTVVNGAAAISQAGSRLSVQQQSAKAIVNWNTFNIGAQAAVNFQQPSTSSVVLNRVSAGGGVSEIYGSLTANGQVFLINPAGTIFGRGAQVNVGGLIASSLDIASDNFLGGNYRFSSGGGAGSILNQGTLTAADGGYIALLAPQVRNEGVIAAQLGTVALGAGNAVTLDINGTGLVSMRVEQAAVDALIANKNLVQADGGLVIMSARAAGQLAGGVINNSGEIHAATVTERNGVIRLEAGDVANSGSIVADGASGGRVTLAADNTTINSGLISALGSEGRGGEIRLLGDKVGLFGTGKLDASGEAGGGTVLVGGNYQGKGPERNASRTVVDSGAAIHANATANGDGGKVIVWADDVTRFSGSIEAKGAPQGGNGGFVETSGKSVLQAYGTVNASAPKGNGGTWLLDPNDITISISTDGNRDGSFNSTNDNAIINNTALGAALTNGTNVSVTTQSAGTNSQPGDISVQAGVTANLSGGETATLNLVAQRNIDFTATGSIGSGAGNLNVNLMAGTNLGVANTPGTNASAITMASGSSISTGPAGNLAATAKLNGVALAGLNIGGDLTVNSGGGAITQASALVVSGTSTITASGANITFSNASNDFTGAVSLTGGSVQITDANALTLGILATGPLSVSSTDALNLGQGTVAGTLSANSIAGAISQAGPLLVSGNASIAAGANPITLTNVANDFQGVVTLSNSGAANGVAITDVNTLTFGTQTLGGNFQVTAPTINAAIVNTTNTGSQSWNGNVTFSGQSVTNGGAFNVTGTTTLSGPMLVNTGSGSTTFSGAVNGGSSLAVTGTGLTTFSAPVGNGTALTSLNTNSGGTTALNGGPVSTTGSQIYGALNLGVGTVLTGSGITFNSTVNGAQSLTVNDSGTTVFNGVVGGVTPLATLTTNAGGSTNINANAIITTGTQNYGDNTFLGSGTTTLTASNIGAGITLNGSMNTLGSLNLTAGGAISELGSGLINASGTLTTVSGSGQILNGTNAVGTLNATNNVSGNIAFTQGANPLTISGINQAGGGQIQVVAGGTLNTTGAVSTNGTALSLTSADVMTIGGNVTGANGSTVNLQVTGADTQLIHSAGGISTLGLGQVSLQADKMMLSGGTISSGAGGVLLSPSTAGKLINLGSASDAAANTLELSNAELATVNTSGQLKIGGGLAGQIIISNPLALGAVAPTLVLNSGGTIGEGPSGQISVGTLTTSSVGGQTFNGANTVGAFGAANTSSGAIALNNTAPTLAITAIAQQASSSSVTISNTGNLSTGGPINSQAGNIALTATNGNETIGGNINSLGGAVSLAATGATSDLLVNAGVSSNAGTITSTAGRDIIFSGSTAATTSTLNATAGRDIKILGGATSALLSSGTMNLTAANDLRILGGTGANTSAQAFASNIQNVNANTVTLTGGSAGSGNLARLSTNGTQTVVAASGITITGGSSGGGFNTGNSAQLNSAGNQNISVGSGGLTLTGGGGALTDNFASVFQSASAAVAVAGSGQSITVNGGGAINLTGGSSAQSGIGTANGHGSFASIMTDGVSQQINFSAGGAINLTGGTVGSRNNAGIQSRGGGAQTITGSPNILITGGASGGIDLESNNAGIFVDSNGSQTITAGNVTLNAGAAGISNAAFMQALTQNITVQGNLSLTGGGSTPGAVNGSGAGLGGRGGNIPTATNLTLNVAGNITLNGGSVANAGAAIGSSNLGGQSTDMTINAGGNVILNPGSGSGARIGSPGSSPAGGNIAVTAGGAIALNDSATQGTGILTQGNVTLQAASISGGTFGKSGIGANALATTSSAGATSLPTLAVGSLTATSTGGPLNLGNGTVTGSLGANSNGSAITESGALTVGGTANITAGAAPITLTSANDFQGVVTLSNSGANAVAITDINTITFSNQTMGGGFSANAPTIIAKDTTNTGSQIWNGNTTFNSTETTNGGDFIVTGTLTLGNNTVINTGSGNVILTGAVGTGTFPLAIGTTGTVSILGPASIGSLAAPVAFTVTPAGLVLAQPISFVFSSPAVPATLVFAPGATVSGFIGGATSAVVIQAIAAPVSQSIPVQAAQAVASIPPEALSGSTASPGTSSTSVATAAVVPVSAAPSSPTPVAAPEAGTVRPTASSGVSKETIKQIDQQISQARTQLFSPALTQLTKDPTVADVPECGATGQGVCVKEGKKKSTVLAEADPVIKRRVALLFGNDRYLAPIPALETPIHDVEDIGKVLQDRLGYETRIVRNATKEQIVDELNRLVTEVDDDDSVFVYYAGHGYQAEKGGGGYWIPTDANNNDASGWISNSAISKFLANMASRQVMLVSDSCYSGTLAQEQKVTSSESTVFDRKEILRKRSVLVMSSGGNEPVADGGHDNHSLFAYHMLRSLNAVEGDLVGGDIHERVRTAVMKEYPQDPQYGAVVSAGHAQGGEYLIEKK